MIKLFDFFPSELKHEVVDYRLSKSKKNKKSRRLPKSNRVKKTTFAYSRHKKLPLGTERQVKSAMSDFHKVKEVTAPEMAEAYKKIVNRATSLKICTMGFSSKFEHCLCNTDSQETENS